VTPFIRQRRKKDKLIKTVLTHSVVDQAGADRNKEERHTDMDRRRRHRKIEN
jgi:hypothetical protein